MKLLSALFAGMILLVGAAHANSATDDANAVYEDTMAFDGGPGSTINTSPDAEDGSADYSL
jgi:hypothetical protein